jgi:hypothetical protein
MAGHGANDDLTFILANAMQILNPRQIDQITGGSQALFERWQKRHAASQQFGILAISENFDNFGKVSGTVVSEGLHDQLAFA